MILQYAIPPPLPGRSLFIIEIRVSTRNTLLSFYEEGIIVFLARLSFVILVKLNVKTTSPSIF